MTQQEDRTVKVTFTADKGNLERSLKTLDDQAKKLHESLKKISDLSSKDNGDDFSAFSVIDQEGLDAVKDLVKLEENRLKIFRQQNRELDIQLTKIRKVAEASGGAGVGTGPGGVLGFLGKGGFGGKAASMLFKGAGTATGFVASAVASQMRLAYGAYADYYASLAGLAGTGVSKSGMDLRARAGVQYGYSPQETAEQARQVGITTGQPLAVTQAQMLTRATTLDMSQASDLLGMLTRAGTGVGGKAGLAGNRELRNIIALGFNSGIADARIPEFIQGVQKVVETQGAIQGGTVNATGVARILQAMGATGAAGLQGSRGGAVLGKLNQAIVNPGGGEAGQALMLQAMGFGRPGGDTSYYEALRQQERGASDPANVKRLFAETRAQYGGGEEQILALREMTGLGITQLEKMREAVATMSGPARDKKLEQLIEDSKPIEKRSLEAMNEVGGHAARIAYLQDRLVRHGQDIYDGVVNFQDVINTAVDKIMPYSKGVFNKLTELADFMVHGRIPGASFEDQPATKAIRELWDSKGTFLGVPFGSDQYKKNDIRNLPGFNESGLSQNAARELLKTNVMERLPRLQKMYDDARKTPGTADDLRTMAEMFRTLEISIHSVDRSATVLTDETVRLFRDTHRGMPATTTNPAKGR